ncbi:hypothetical protein [Hyphobacterium sp.]|uniref:hypothetical protein n=1 Tax=Hyphobacterium sp. TaxID=2004662 RepID=UPI0037480FC1
MTKAAPLPTLEELEIDIRFEGFGDVFLDLKSGGRRFELDGSYCWDSVHDLICAAINIESGAWRPQIVQFELEPGQFQMTLKPEYHHPTSTRYLRLTVDELRSSPGFETASEPRELRFDATLMVDSFPRAVYRAVAPYAKQPDELYEIKWDLPFPEKAYRALEAAIKTDRRPPIQRTYSESHVVLRADPNEIKK